MAINEDIPYEAISIFQEAEFSEEDLYYIFYPLKPISRIDRGRLKEMGFQLQKHSRDKSDIWVFDKKVPSL